MTKLHENPRKTVRIGGAIPFIHPDHMPEVFAVPAFGDCMEPLIRDGSILVFSKKRQVEVGNIVMVTFSREAAPIHGAPGFVKRLAEPLPPAGVEGWITLEMINPLRRIRIWSADVLAVHAFVGIGDATSTEGTVKIAARSLTEAEREVA